MSEAIDEKEIVREFVFESTERLDLLKRDLLAVKRDIASPELVAELFRAMHTIKGTGAALAFAKLEVIAHAGEELLARLREGKLALNPAITRGLLAMVGSLRGLLDEITRHGSEGEGDYSEVIRQLEILAGGQSPSPPPVPVTQRSSTPSLAFHCPVSGSRSASSPAGLDMQRLAKLWSRFPGLVRSLAMRCGKQVEFDMRGEETEIDRTVVALLNDPLIHILRNAIDHGIETPEQRNAAGKPPIGRLCLRACRGVEQLKIEVSDDGAGINFDKVRQCAIDRGVVTEEQASGMSERELVSLVFLPGISTAETVTHISGRGVGMDVVRTSIENIDGVVDVQSVAGKGTTVKITIPLSVTD